MSKVNIYNQKAETVGELELNAKVFAVKPNEALVHQAVVAQLANERQVLAHTKDRSEVRGGGRKPWRQKGTGRARQGSIRSPQWIGGGVVFGPLKTRNFSLKINKKMKQKAIFMALSDKLAANDLIVLDNLEMKEHKTKAFDRILTNLEKKVFAVESKKRSVLVVNDNNENVKRSGRNLTGVEIMNVDNINIVDLLKYKKLIFTVDGVKKLEERYK
ncbi:MAG: 50S ribosomal protein L4 [Patescibacteria group bacterium]